MLQLVWIPTAKRIEAAVVAKIHGCERRASGAGTNVKGDSMLTRLLKVFAWPLLALSLSWVFTEVYPISCFNLWVCVCIIPWIPAIVVSLIAACDV